MVGSITIRNFSFFCGNVLRLYDFCYENTEHEWSTILYWFAFYEFTAKYSWNRRYNVIAVSCLILDSKNVTQDFTILRLFPFIKVQTLMSRVESLYIHTCSQPRINSKATAKLIDSIPFIFLVQRISICLSIKVTQFRYLAPKFHVGCRLHYASPIELYSFTSI